jgi:hypothetical protein
MSFQAAFKQLSNSMYYKSLVRRRISKIILGNSVIRVFKKGTKDDLLKSLGKLALSTLNNINSHELYDSWHAKKVNTIYHCLCKKNKVKFKRDLEGLKWGHSTKIFNLFIGHLVFYSPFLESGTNKSLRKLVHVPLDKKVFTKLREYKANHVPKSIKETTRIQYVNLQIKIRKEAEKRHLPPFYFDEHCWTPD